MTLLVEGTMCWSGPDAVASFRVDRRIGATGQVPVDVPGPVGVNLYCGDVTTATAASPQFAGVRHEVHQCIGKTCINHSARDALEPWRERVPAEMG